MDSLASTLIGDCRDVLPGLPDASVHCVITSPPYWNLRDYGTSTWEGGDPACPHEVKRYTAMTRSPASQNGNAAAEDRLNRTHCRCGAARRDRQIGLESTVAGYIAALVGVFREVRRVLRHDGTVWLNLGDTHNSYNGNAKQKGPSGVSAAQESDRPRQPSGAGLLDATFKSKDLMLIPHRVVIALQEDGWYIRSTIVWHKPNPMPESARDRPTKAHEYLFLLTKSARYFFDPVAIAEPVSGARPGVPRVVQRSHRAHQGVVFGNDLGLEHLPAVGPVAPAGAAYAHRLFEIAVHVASTLLDGTQSQHQISLPSLDAEVWEKGARDDDSAPVRRAPEEHRATELAARLLCADLAPKHFLEEIHRLAVALPESDVLRIARGIALGRGAPGVNGDGDAAIRVNDAGQVGEDDGVGFCRHNNVPPCQECTPERTSWQGGSEQESTRNKRDVWTIPTQPHPFAHFAVMPEALAEPCVLAGTSAKGACADCGAPWRRVTERVSLMPAARSGNREVARWDAAPVGRVGGRTTTHERGWEPTCDCASPADPVPCVILDPFVGSGTTQRVSSRFGRRSIGIDLSPRYGALVDARTSGVQMEMSW